MIEVLILLPLMAGIISFVSHKQRILEMIVMLAALFELGLGITLTNQVLSQSAINSSLFILDGFTSLLMLITVSVGIITSGYAVGYLRQEVAKKIIGFHRVRECYVLMHLFMFALLLAITSSSPVMTWIAIEATTLSTVFLISIYNRPSTLEAAWKYLIINSVGLLLAFLGTLVFLAGAYQITDMAYLSWKDITEVAKQINPQLAKIGFILIIIGYGTKMGIAPMHTWRPDSYSKAPIPVVALLSGVLLNIAFLAILKFKMVTDLSVGVGFTNNLFIFFGLGSLAVAAFSIFNQKNYKRLLAYSSVEHAGIIMMGVGFGGLAIYASLLHIIYHSFAKSLLFLLSGNIFLKYSSSRIKDVIGAHQALPMTGAMFLIGFLAISGLPPFGMFFTEIYILISGFTHHPYLTGLALIFLIVVFMGFLRQVLNMLYGQPSKSLNLGEFSLWTTIFPLIGLLILLILSVYLPSSLQNLLNQAVKELTI